MMRLLRDLVRSALPRRWHRSTRLRAELSSRLGSRVLAGPFAGLAYVEESFGSAYWPKLLGTYEMEIREPIEQILQRSFERVLVAGAAEGYYAVGMARRLPRASVVAWEALAAAREVMVELSRRNSVDERIEIRGICDVGELSRALKAGSGALVLCDIEGGEAVLLDPEAVPELRGATMVVEVHDCFIPGVTDLLRRRFAGSHDIDQRESVPRNVNDLPALDLPAAFRGALLQLLSEARPKGNGWLILTPRERLSG